MNRQQLFTNYYKTQGLPPEQPPIETQSVQKFNLFVSSYLRRSRQLTGYSMIAVVTGRSGAGKSVALDSYIASLSPSAHTGNLPCIKIHAKPRSSPLSILEDIYQALGEHLVIRKFTVYKLADKAAEAIARHDLQLLFFDESEQLDSLCVDFLRYIYDLTGCPLAFIGTESIINTLRLQEKFQSRSTLYQKFLPPTKEEVLETILPKLVFPHWTFDPSNDVDIEMGQYVWTLAQSSFRKLRLILQVACIVADETSIEHITLATIKEGIQMIPFLAHESTDGDDEEEELPEGHGSYEEASEQRQEANKTRKRPNKRTGK